MVAGRGTPGQSFDQITCNLLRPGVRALYAVNQGLASAWTLGLGRSLSLWSPPSLNMKVYNTSTTTDSESFYVPARYYQPEHIAAVTKVLSSLSWDWYQFRRWRAMAPQTRMTSLILDINFEDGTTQRVLSGKKYIPMILLLKFHCWKGLHRNILYRGLKEAPRWTV